jgi:hypothetical protein
LAAPGNVQREFAENLFDLGEGLGLLCHRFGGHGPGGDQDSVVEGCGLVLVEGVVEGWLFGVEDASA